MRSCENSCLIVVDRSTGPLSLLLTEYCLNLMLHLSSSSEFHIASRPAHQALKILLFNFHPDRDGCTEVPLRFNDVINPAFPLPLPLSKGGNDHVLLA
jgi:hypothetical protein